MIEELRNITRRKVIGLFWGFIAIVLTLQLSAVDDFTLIQAACYSIVITGTFGMYVFLLSKYLIRKQIKIGKISFLLVGIFLLSIIVAAWLTFEDYAIYHFFGKDFEAQRFNMLPQFFGMWMATILISGVACAFELYQYHIATLKSTQLLKDSLNELEMKSIRQQLSPHFTFNILNNLQFLIQKDKDEALKLLSQYSKILRYYVYESQHKAILLNDEISFLKTYLELEKDRLKGEASVAVDIVVEPNQIKIAPFILSTFIENVFKHLSRQNKWISVKICSKSNRLAMHVQNTYDNYDVDGNESVHAPGVGLDQVQKRLELIYPGKYTLEFQRGNGVFSVELNLNFVGHEG